MELLCKCNWKRRVLNLGFGENYKTENNGVRLVKLKCSFCYRARFNLCAAYFGLNL